MHKQVLNKILNSDTFKNKEVLKSVLLYLFECKIKNKEITEQGIAKDVFKRQDFKGSDDTIVRVNLFKVRQALQKYYLEEGKDDAVHISIPKGTYTLQFNKIEAHQNNQTPKNNKRLLYALGTLLVITWVWVIVMLGSKSHSTNPLWKSFDNDKPTTVVLCAPHFEKYLHKSSNRVLVVREMGKNSSDEMDSISSSLFPTSSFQNVDFEFSYFMPTNIYPLPYIFKGLNANNVDNIELFSLKEFNNKELNSNNVIFLGSLKSMGYTANLLKNTSIRLQQDPIRIVLNDSIDLIAKNLPQENYVDYALVTKLKGESNNSILVVASLYTTGVTGVLHKFGDNRFFDELKQYDKLSDEFELIVKVTGVNYSNLELDIIHYKALK